MTETKQHKIKQPFHQFARSGARYKLINGSDVYLYRDGKLWDEQGKGHNPEGLDITSFYTVK